MRGRGGWAVRADGGMEWAVAGGGLQETETWPNRN